jgi:oxygen-independent coproporphyrinogen-3 oxidase
VSHSIASPAAKKLLAPYIDNLVTEIKDASKYADEFGLRLESVYFGGGTPGILEPGQIDTLQSAIENCFDLSHLKEYTVEIGRPDTVTPEKLNMLKLHNTDRISINPQSFNQKTLDAIGRFHTPEDTLKAYRLARSYGFGCINMDLIAGLPGETTAEFKDSLDTAVMLSPENITVHTLALKRSSEMNYSGESVKDGEEAGKMLSYAKECLTNSGYSPYYMYRQSKCVGNLENVGWTVPGKEGFYNVIMMEECHTVIGAGAGAVTKLCEPGGNKVERIFNYKFPYEYVSGFDVILERKEKIREFYNSLKSPGKDDE